MPLYVFLQRGCSFTSRKLYACLEKFLCFLLLSDWAYDSGARCIVCWLCCMLYMPLFRQAAQHYFYFHRQSKLSLGKYMSDHQTFDWRVYFSRPIHFSRTPVCGPFKNLWFSCRRYFKVPLPILLAALPLALRLRSQNLVLHTTNYAGYVFFIFLSLLILSFYLEWSLNT